MSQQDHSAELVVDFSEATSFDPIPVGWYTATIAEAKPGESQAGNSKISLILEITGTLSEAAEAAEAVGRKLFDDLVLEGKGTWKTKQMLTAVFGATDGVQMRLKASDLIGAEVEARVVQKVWREEDGGDGEARSRITRYRQCTLSAGSTVAMDDMFTPDPASKPAATAKKKKSLFGSK